MSRANQAVLLAYSQAANDPSFGSVLILAHFNGTNGDVGPFTNSATATGAPVLGGAGLPTNCTLDTATVKFGTASLHMASPGGPLVSSMSSQCDIGTGDFTLEYWLNPTAAVSRHVDYGGTATNGTTSFDIRHSTTVRFETNFVDRITGSSTLSTGAWTFIAVCRASGTTRLFINGTQEGSNYTDSTTYTGNGRPFYVGRIEGGSGNTMNMDELRLTIGVARYTSNFTTPTGPFPNS